MLNSQKLKYVRKNPRNPIQKKNILKEEYSKAKETEVSQAGETFNTKMGENWKVIGPADKPLEFDDGRPVPTIIARSYEDGHKSRWTALSVRQHQEKYGRTTEDYSHIIRTGHFPNKESEPEIDK